MKGIFKTTTIMGLTILYILAARFIAEAENLTELLKYFTIYLVSAMHVMIFFTFSE